MPVEDSHSSTSWVAVALSNPAGLWGHSEATPALKVPGIGRDHHQAGFASSTRAAAVLVGVCALGAYLPKGDGPEGHA